MLLNNNGQVVEVSKDQLKGEGQRVAVLFNLREVHEPMEKFPKGWATLEARAKIKQ